MILDSVLREHLDFFHLGKGTWEHERGLKAREAGRSGLEASWPWAAEKGQH